MKKVFVLRTESLLASKNPTLRFGDDNTIVIGTMVCLKRKVWQAS